MNEPRDLTPEELVEVYGQDFQEPHEQVVEVEHHEPEPEPEPDRSSDPAYIRVETAEYLDGATLGEATRGLNIRSGRTLVSYRLRTPEEAGLDHVEGVAVLPVKLFENTSGPKSEPGDEYLPGAPPALIEKYLQGQRDSTPPREDAMSYGRWRNSFGR